MPPQPVLERHLIFKPRPPPGLANLPTGSGPQGPQQQELQKTRQMLNTPLNYVQVVGLLENKELTPRKEQPVVPNMNGDHDLIMTGDEDESEQNRKAFQWYLEFNDIPEPGKVSATSRAASKTRILEGDVIKFMNDLGYEYLSQYVTTGDKFYDQDTTLFLYKVMQASDQSTQNTTPTTATINTTPDISKLTPLDPSEGYVLQASIEIADGNSPDLKDKATQQLLAIKDTLRSSVDLTPGDRLALDTRVPVRRVR
ncbi:hypothetical protein GJ744_009406 [Endocarpon pusillum]|uniref:Mediator of RNA polymerase II transcription subunit 18 n=1 Tax=Endocarpon pusillum TaxID=364733 RepID=A0A8H7AJI7_9EURO|nr:hypothetical protein GJ744_009406 [Endocarpon pusillum]